MASARLEDLSGFRRRFRISPGEASVCCDVEDDYHCMSVVIRHDGTAATSVEARMHRAPWTTCPGAEAKLCETFTGLALRAFANRGEKTANCTHLYDLAVLAANHALDDQPTVYDILVSDPVDGMRRAELRKDGRKMMGWAEAGLIILEPDELAGTPLFEMQSWIQSLEPALQEAARLLRWGNLLANGRSIPIEQQSDATRMPANCYTFQPERREQARRVGEVRDFSRGVEQPLELLEIAL
jgi:hypothetical protein